MKSRLKDFLERDGLSQKAFSDVSGIGVNTVSQLARNAFRRLDGDTAEKVCRFFGVALGEMFYIEDAGDE